MAVKIRCPNCDKEYHVREESLGGRATCKKCGTSFTVEMKADETAGAKPGPSDSPSSAESAGRAEERPSLAAPAEPSPAGGSPSENLGPYSILRRLGGGAMGEVWLAWDPALQRNVAIKTLRPEVALSSQGLDRFLREARLAAKLHHTNAVTVYQVGVEGKTAYIAMEYVEGQSLDKAVSAGKPMEWREATQAVRDAAAGLAAAHKFGLIHRDIKPANLMRTSDGVTKVADFGLARAQAGQTQITQQGAILGTPAYMAPEVWRREEADARSDLYSLAGTYYCLLTGEAPFDADNFVALGYQHTHEPIPDPRGKVDGIPDEVCRILLAGLAKDPRRRYQDAEQMISNLHAILAGSEGSLSYFGPWHELVAASVAAPAEPLEHSTTVSRQQSSAAGTRGQGDLAVKPGRKNQFPSRAAEILSILQGYLPARRPLRWRLTAGAIAVAVLLLVGWMALGSSNEGIVAIDLGNLTVPVKVTIDGVEIPHVGRNTPLRFKTGEHILEVSATNFKTTNRRFSVKRGGNDIVKVVLESKAKPLPLGPHSHSEPKLSAAVLPPFSPPPPRSEPKLSATATPPFSSPHSAPSRGFLAQQPAFAQALPKWEPLDPSLRAKIADSRARALKDLQEFSWGTLLGMVVAPRNSPRPMSPADTAKKKARPPGNVPSPENDAAEFTVPQRFILVGEVASVRTNLKNTVVYLRSPGQAQAGIGLPHNRSSGLNMPLSSVAAIEFEGRKCLAWLADFQPGDPVRVVVARRQVPKEKQVATLPPMPMPPMGRHMPGMSMPLLLRDHLAELRPFASQSSVFGPGACWCLHGEGIEKQDHPETWIDESLGRAEKLVNPEEVRRSIDVLLRGPLISRGMTGRVLAKFEGARKEGEDTMVILSLSAGKEGQCTWEANFGAKVEIGEFLNYPQGQPVEAVVGIVGEQPLSFLPTSANPLNPGMLVAGAVMDDLLPWWNGLKVDGIQIRIPENPATLVDAEGSRRVVADPALWTPDTAYAMPAKAAGKEVAWSGTLDQLRRQNGETHLVVSIERSVFGLKAFEAYAPDLTFYDQLADYLAGNGNQRGEAVEVIGVVCRADSAAVRLEKASPLLTIKSVQRKNEPTSLATVGGKRDPATMRKSTMRDTMSAISDDFSVAGTEVKIVGQFMHYLSMDVQVKVATGGSTREITVRFENANESMFADYERDDKVEVVGIVVAKTAAERNRSRSFLNPELLGKSIVRLGNSRSRVTDKGREFPALDFQEDKKAWEACRFDHTKRAGKKFRGSGVFSGYAQGNSYFTIRIERVFFTGIIGDTLKLACGADEKTERFLKEMSPGTEVTFEFGYDRTGSSELIHWMAAIDDPENRYAFRAPRLPGKTPKSSNSRKNPNDVNRLLGK
jgi:predicted Zn finger-like uncharacterized protein